MATGRPGTADRARVAVAEAGASRERLLRDLAKLVAVPSVSAQRRHRADVDAAARLLARRLHTAGLTDVWEERGGGPPVVVATTLRNPTGRAGAGSAMMTRGRRPHVLVYAHYDVQPAEDLEQWSTHPFRLSRIGDDVYGRGTADNKGPLLAHVAAFEALRRSGDLPVDVTFVLDGEEEVGSPHLPAVLRRLRGWLDVDVAVVSDTRILGPLTPALVRSLRGSVSARVRVIAPFPPLHVGAWAGTVVNPAIALADVLSSLHDADGRVAVEGFYRGARLMEPAARAPRRSTMPLWSRWGVPGFTPVERTTVLPALTVTAVRAGGPTMAIPAVAEARLNARLVAGQDPRQVYASLVEHVTRATPRGLTCTVEPQAQVPAVETPMRHIGVRAASLAYLDAFGRLPEITRSGGTIAAVSYLRSLLKVPIVLMGFTLPDAQIHSANEHLHLPVLWRAVDTVIAFHTKFASLAASKS